MSEILKQFKGILEGVENKLGDISDLFEDATEDAKQDMRRELTQTKRRMMREARDEFKQLQERFGRYVDRRYQADDCGVGGCRGEAPVG